jgi:hypothetical protein
VNRKDSTIYNVTDYWLVNGQLHFTTLDESIGAPRILLQAGGRGDSWHAESDSAFMLRARLRLDQACDPAKRCHAIPVAALATPVLVQPNL